MSPSGAATSRTTRPLRRKTWKGAALGPRQAELLADLAVRIWLRRSATTLPTNTQPLVEFVKIDGPGQHQQAAAISSSPRLPIPANQAPAIVPAHSIRMSSRP
jgi:hypothetical protein